MRAQLLRVIAAALVLAVIASGNDTWPYPPMGSEWRHSSGIVLLGPVDYPRLFAQWKMSEKLDRSYNSARILAEQNRSAFGYPWLDSRAEEVIVSVANAEGEAFARRWLQSGLKQSIDKPGGAVVLDIPPPEVGVRFRTVDRTIEQLERIQHAMGPGLADIPGSDRIFLSGPDYEHNRVVYETDRINDALLHGLAARFGTEALAVRIDPNADRFVNCCEPQRLFEPVSPINPVVLVFIALSAMLFGGLAILAVRRRLKI